MTFVRDFKGHKAAVTVRTFSLVITVDDVIILQGLVFRRGTRQLFSSSRDRSVKAWDLDQMGYVDTMYCSVVRAG